MRVVQRWRGLPKAIVASAFLSLTSVAAPPSGPHIRLLHRNEPAGALAQLADEIRIYTSDLTGDVVVDSPAGDPLPSTPTDASVVLIWLERDGTATSLHVLRGGDGKRMQIPLPSADSPSTLRTAALKVRAFVAETRLSTARLASHDAAVASSAVLPAPPPPPKPAPSPAPEPPRAAAAPPETPAPPIIAPPHQPPFEAQLLVSAAHSFAPGQPALEGTLRGFWWHGRLGVGAEASLLRGFEAERVDGTRLHVSDVPVGVEGVVRTRLGPVELAAGPRLRLHLIEVHVRDALRESSETRPAVGVGALFMARWAFTTHFAVVASASAEALFPHWDFELDDTAETRVPSGWVAVGVGLSWTGP